MTFPSHTTARARLRPRHALYGPARPTTRPCRPMRARAGCPCRAPTAPDLDCWYGPHRTVCRASAFTTDESLSRSELTYFGVSLLAPTYFTATIIEKSTLALCPTTMLVHLNFDDLTPIAP
ncbi:hypothetical protein BV25DRAFT_1820031 [Artomyces pyxidatus]|uniref:Uncharacterized protein n=1 Tax=Artomyces pyxidatus TaxID=48021 RepID=A0ACB8TEP9_9AGAM|nr:hypothetical protein BV25DRAFT_1820031 [Artomyces pyxidatus]